MNKVSDYLPNVVKGGEMSVILLVLMVLAWKGKIQVILRFVHFYIPIYSVSIFASFFYINFTSLKG